MAYKTPNRTSEYLRSLMKTPTDPLLIEIMARAEECRIPILLPESSAFLEQLLLLSKPKNVLEIGTAIGYSGMIFLKNSDCRLVTIDKNASYLGQAREFFARASVADRCTIIEGDAELVIPSLQEEFDFIFLDGPKTKYVEFLPLLIKLLKKGGILLADNVLFDGMVAGEVEVNPKKKNIVAKLEQFLQQLYQNNELFTSVLNVGDGLSLSIKLY